MTRSFIALSTVVLMLAVGSTAQAARCAAGANHAACAGPNGVAVAGPNGARTATKTYNTYGHAAAGTSVTGRYGNTATKGVVQGCGWVNGQRVCR